MLSALGFMILLGACGSVTSPKPGLNVVASVSSQTAGSLTFRIGVENTGAEIRTLNFGSAQFCEIEVKDRSGKLVWNYAHDASFAALCWGLEVAPGESHVREFVWDLTGNNGKPVASGSYRAKVTMMGSPRNGDLSTDLNLTI